MEVSGLPTLSTHKNNNSNNNSTPHTTLYEGKKIVVDPAPSTCLYSDSVSRTIKLFEQCAPQKNLSSQTEIEIVSMVNDLATYEHKLQFFQQALALPYNQAGEVFIVAVLMTMDSSERIKVIRYFEKSDCSFSHKLLDATYNHAFHSWDNLISKIETNYVALYLKLSKPEKAQKIFSRRLETDWPEIFESLSHYPAILFRLLDEKIIFSHEKRLKIFNGLKPETRAKIFCGAEKNQQNLRISIVHYLKIEPRKACEALSTSAGKQLVGEKLAHYLLCKKSDFQAISKRLLSRIFSKKKPSTRTAAEIMAHLPPADAAETLTWIWFHGRSGEKGSLWVKKCLERLYKVGGDYGFIGNILLALNNRTIIDDILLDTPYFKRHYADIVGKVEAENWAQIFNHNNDYADKIALHVMEMRRIKQPLKGDYLKKFKEAIHFDSTKIITAKEKFPVPVPFLHRRPSRRILNKKAQQHVQETQWKVDSH